MLLPPDAPWLAPHFTLTEASLHAQCTSVSSVGPCWPGVSCLLMSHSLLCWQVTPQLRQLEVQGSPLGACNLTALAALSGLQCLSVSMSPNTPFSLMAITCLSHLKALQVSAMPSDKVSPHDTSLISRQSNRLCTWHSSFLECLLCHK